MDSFFLVSVLTGAEKADILILKQVILLLFSTRNMDGTCSETHGQAST